MTFDEYQKKAASFAEYGGGWEYPVCGLAEEAGEVCGKFAKMIRDDGGILTPNKRMEIRKELGDVLWMTAEIARFLGYSLSYIALQNIAKLEDRKDRGVLCGDGDNR